MDNHQFQMFQNALASINEKCDEIKEAMQAHVEEDKTYWRKIDQVEGQVSLVKYILGLVGLSGLAAWLGIKH